jgi:hypothetical protein
MFGTALVKAFFPGGVFGVTSQALAHQSSDCSYFL